MNTKNLIILSTVTLFSLLIIAVPAYADVIPNVRTVTTTQVNRVNVDTLVTVTPILTPTATITIKPIKRVTIAVALKKTNAINEIDRRVSSLNGLTNLINQIRKISDAQRVTLLTQVQIEVGQLTDLKSKIEAEIDATNLKSEKQSVVDLYRIYALFVPKIQIIANADKVISISDALITKTSDTTLQKIISDSKTKAQDVLGLVISLTPEGYPGNKTSLTKARDMLKEARISLNSVYTTINKK